MTAMRGLLAFALPVALALPADGAVRLEVGTAEGRPGERVEVSVYLHGDGAAGSQVDIGFDPQTPIASRSNGRPDCAVNLDLGAASPPSSWRDTAYALLVAPAWAKGPQSSYWYLPVDCRPGVDCEGIRTLLLTLDSVSSIPDGSLLYRCTIAIADDAAPGRYALACGNPGSANVDGTALETICDDGAIVVLGDDPTPSATPLPSSTATPPPTPTLTFGADRAPSDGSGCQIGGRSRGGGLALMSALALAWWRSRRRRVQADG